MGKAFPQAVYFPIRTLYLSLKMEQKEKCKCVRERREKGGGVERERERERNREEGEREKGWGASPCVLCSFAALCIRTAYFISCTCTCMCILTVKADQQSKASTSQAPHSVTSGEPMDITTPGDISRVLVSTLTCKR